VTTKVCHGKQAITNLLSRKNNKNLHYIFYNILSCLIKIIGLYYKSKLELKLNLREILPIKQALNPNFLNLTIEKNFCSRYVLV